MKAFEIDTIATRALMGDMVYGSQAQEVTPYLEKVAERVLEIGFDCTPDWGVQGTELPRNIQLHQQNWYLRDKGKREIAETRLSNLRHSILKNVLIDAVNDFFPQNPPSIIGYGLYGSYMVCDDPFQKPEDLDVLLLTNGEHPPLDALRYSHKKTPEIFIDPAKGSTSSDELGLSIIPKSAFETDPKSLIVTDSALLGVCTVHPFGEKVKAKPVPAFVLNLNTKKVLNWGMSTLLSNQQTFIKRMDEVCRMRAMVATDNPGLGLLDYDIEANLAILRNSPVTKDSFLMYADQMMQKLNIDELQIRRNIWSSLTNEPWKTE